ncbi:phosphoenolpyruvate-protein phosphotransferase [Treponema sp. JC4]|uniref:phosphoenolpyruvate--protein phosphotransferase n=1 Tax=Treponema sp. JC4 TaxID=1124982 RepID=UPI00025B0C19|nr:phosphoenolpyruvate--protein phosphotransferase [Treponema sp. JC4]EID85468.1 phosphoenolpyruvate-protein phosphotransferase [Treponema sp. JC4]
MKRYNGKSIYKGIAIGPVKILKKVVYDTSLHPIENPEAEIERYNKARDTAVAQLQAIYEKAKTEVGEEAAAIFDVQSMLIGDDDFTDSVYSLIRDEKANAEYAVFQSGETISQIFAEMEDEYMKARSADIKDIARRVVTVLCGGEDENVDSDAPAILYADDLTPAETVALDKSKILAFVTKFGSSQSHTAILARTMNIPAITGVVIDSEWNGKECVVDSFAGEVILEPDEETLAEKTKLQKEALSKRELLQNLKGKESITLGGKKINLYANIGSVADADLALENDAEGIGLFRSEFLYLGRHSYPTEDEQFVAYKNVAKKMNGKKVIIRTLDIGADKQADYFKLDQEENPAMGFRAIRICLDRPELFKTQLRAIYRASAFGNLAIMYPMIISVDEVHRIKKIASDVCYSLNKENIPYGNVEQGIMIETPAAVMMSEELAQEVDFFSIGTNDLTQYTLAIDRQNSRLENFYDAHHPAVLREIQMTIENGHKHGCWVGICGELGADLELTETFINMGIDELSVSPSHILALRDRIRNIK